MNEQFDNIEARLSRLRLRPISGDLENRIADELDGDLDEAAPENRTGSRHPQLADIVASRPRDRWLWSAITSGAIAACVIFAVLITDARSGIPAARLPVEPHMQPANSSGIALASAGQSWGDELGPASFWSHP